MKYLLLLIPLLFLSCAKSKYVFVPTMKVDISREVAVIDSYLDNYGMLPSGVNGFYRFGYYIVALEKHGLLDTPRVERFCDALEHSKVPHGFKRFPEYPEDLKDTLMTRDDYQAVWLALFYAKKYSTCAVYLSDYAYVNRALSNDVWLLFNDYTERTLRNFSPAILSDGETYLRARAICGNPQGTSDKLQFALELIAARESPSYYSKASDEYCHSQLDFNQVLDGYYGENRPDCPYCTEFKTVLKGLL